MNDENMARYNRARYGSDLDDAFDTEDTFDFNDEPDMEGAPSTHGGVAQVGGENPPYGGRPGNPSAPGQQGAMPSPYDAAAGQHDAAPSPYDAAADQYDAAADVGAAAGQHDAAPGQHGAAGGVYDTGALDPFENIVFDSDPRNLSGGYDGASPYGPYDDYPDDGYAYGAATGYPTADDYALTEDYAEAAAQRRSYSRAAVEEQLAEDGQVGPQGKRRRSPVAYVVAALVAVLALGAGAAWAYLGNISGNLQEGVTDELRNTLVHTNMANEPFYMLLLGTDGSIERDEAGDLDGVYRSDSMMLARIDAPNKKATLISIPRDLSVNLGEHGEQKINAAYAFGGAPLAVETVSDLAGVGISHYAQIDFDGFAAMVDALGGVEVNVPVHINDADAGGELLPGEQTLNGEQALILTRTRSTYNDTSDPDKFRAANQRMVLSAIASKLLDSDIGTIARTTEAMSQYVTTDLALNDIIGLAQAMEGIDPATDIYTASVPTTSQYVNSTWYEYLNRKEWADMMDRVDAGLPPTEETVVDEKTGTVLSSAGDGSASMNKKYFTVTVKNATDIEGAASDLRTKLMDAGYAEVVIGDVNPQYDYPETRIVYKDPAREIEAQQLQEAIGQGQVYYDDAFNYVMENTDLLVIIGKDWQA